MGEQKDLGAVIAVKRPKFPDLAQLFAESVVHGKDPFFIDGQPGMGVVALLGQEFAKIM